MENTLVKAGRIFLSVMFIFSGISKLVSLPFFDGLVAELLIGADYYNHYQALWWVQVLTRVIVSSEILLGAALLQDFKFKQIVLPTVQLLLLLFTVHLFYEGLNKGFVDGNCGCFGDILPMTILESIIKNVVGMLVGAYVYMKFNDGKDQRFASWVMPFLLGFVCLATVWMTIKDYTPAQPTVIPSIIQEEIEPVIEENTEIINSDTTSEEVVTENTEEVEKTPEKEVKKEVAKKENKVEKVEKVENAAPTPLDITKSLFKPYTSFSDGSVLNVEKGEQLVCMFSMTCGHCQEVYKDFCQISSYAKFPKPFLFNYGKEFEQNYFFNQAGGCKDAHIRMEDYAGFMRLLEGKSFPRILHFKDGKLLKSWDIETYSKKSFLDYFGIQEKEAKTTNELGLEEENKDAELEF